ncbi:MAG: ParB-like nuclease domain-containing protein [Sedimentisphaerales bacterium]|nr:ParB-like nuclease domain-containing protein [Sedimentisphaerales bacterium]
MNDCMRRIPLDKLVPHPDNANRMSRANFAKLVRNIERTGHYEPLVVRRHPDRRDQFQIINGHHRCQALRQLGHDTAQAVVWRVNDEQTDILLATLNRLSGRDVLEKKLTVLRRLCRKRPLHDLAKLVAQTQGQLQRLMSRKLSSTKVRSRQPLYATPLVFFVNEAQQRIIEEALTATVARSSEPTRAAKRAAALARLAECFASRQ